ncbi:hypothetical protein HPB48_013154 [Haemaphysalis longicornis]|uniref:Uncharacterized protein n=1 Tax=Haemaphysalis longicornis TaxID=44386 RepID=A0A9J6GPY8_HAELO|nr:hypothetical protein HPB48_013154 [Haemaphysalis longicornis]
MQYYYVRNIVRRNCDFITRAISCSTGDRSRKCAEAFELVADNPALVERVCELQSVGEKEASQIVRNTLSALQGLDDFMGITGVVKRCVSCTNSKDHKLQLEDLDGYSWLHVRRLLRISDVLPHSFSP